MSTTADQRVTTNTYNALGRLESVTTPEGTIHYEYDYLGRHTRTYTGAKDTTGVSTPSDGIAVTDTHYAYDSLGRLDTVTTVERFDTPLATPEVTDYFHDLLGNLDETHSPNGVIADYQYDNLNRLELLRHFRDENDNDTYESGVDALLAEYDYELLADGRRSSVSEIDHLGNTTQINWMYDNANRLVRESYNSHDDTQDFITDYVFDLVGNRLAKKTDTGPTFVGDPTFDEVVTNTHDANDRLLTETKDAPGTTEDRHTVYTYDNTQQIGKTVHAGLDNAAPIASQTDYAYNVQGRMATVTIDADGNGLSDTRLDYEYNNRGIRTSQTKTTDGNNDGDFNDPEDTSERTDYLVDEHNPTGYAQVLEEWLDGQLKTSYTLGHDVLTQAAITGAIHHLLYDGHGSTRMLVDALGLPLLSEIYAYDAYGNPINFDPAQALTSLLYSGEQTDAATGFQYLRARYYDPNTGTFNRLDPFFGNLSDPQSLHKYLYVHGDPIQGVDPLGLWFGVACAIGIGVMVGGIGGYMIGGLDGAFYGALLGGGLVTLGILGFPGTAVIAGVNIAHVGYWLGGGFLAWKTLRSGWNNWGFKKTNNPKKVAVVTGELGYAVDFQMWMENTSVLGFAQDMAAAGHNVTAHHNPDEAKLATLMNENDVVVVVSHGPGNSFAIMGDYYDATGSPLTGLRLGGATLHDNDNPAEQSFPGSGITMVPQKAWVTANEIQGQVDNPDLILAVAGCRVGRTNKFSQAIGIDPAQGGHFASYNGDLNPSGINEILNYARDWLNDGQATAATNFGKLEGEYVLDPTNDDFYN